MSSTKFRVESGMQMILRLTRKKDLNKFYPSLFKNGPKLGHTIEMYSEDDTSCLLFDIICEALIPFELGGKESGVIIFNTDGKFNLDIMKNIIKYKVVSRRGDLPSLDNVIQDILNNLLVFEIYDATQLYTTIHNLDAVLINQPNISLIVFDSLTAFYWSEQSFKIIKMDVYLKDLLKILQRAIRDYKIVTLFTRPQYFRSNKDNIGNLEACCEHPSIEHLNYRVHVEFNDNGIHQTTIRTYNELYKGLFRINGNNIKWC